MRNIAGNQRLSENVNRDDIKKYLHILGQELQKQQVLGQILLVDGVLVLLDVRKPKMRRDIGAYLKGDKTAIDIPKDINAHFGGEGAAIREAALTIAEREGLPDGWLNDALKELFFTQPVREKWLEFPGLRIFLAPTDYVLAMKVAATNSPQEGEDIRLLAEKLGIAKTQDMLAHVTTYIPKELLTPEMWLRMKQCFDQEGGMSE